MCVLYAHLPVLLGLIHCQNRRFHQNPEVWQTMSFRILFEEELFGVKNTIKEYLDFEFQRKLRVSEFCWSKNKASDRDCLIYRSYVINEYNFIIITILFQTAPL